MSDVEETKSAGVASTAKLALLFAALGGAVSALAFLLPKLALVDGGLFDGLLGVLFVIPFYTLAIIVLALPAATITALLAVRLASPLQQIPYVVTVGAVGAVGGVVECVLLRQRFEWEFAVAVAAGAITCAWATRPRQRRRS